MCRSCPPAHLVWRPFIVRSLRFSSYALSTEGFENEAFVGAIRRVNPALLGLAFTGYLIVRDGGQIAIGDLVLVPRSMPTSLIPPPPSPWQNGVAERHSNPGSFRSSPSKEGIIALTDPEQGPS